MTTDTRMNKIGTIRPEKANADSSIDNLIDNLEGHNTQKGHIPVLIFLAIGMVLQLTGVAFFVLAGTLICVSVCGLICLWVCASAVFSHNDEDSVSGTSEFLE